MGFRKSKNSVSKLSLIHIFYDSRQVIRAGLEDHFMGKLTGIPMGCDCCYTNHMQADQNDIENLSMLLASAGVNYILGVPTSDDVMLNYQTNAYHLSLIHICSSSDKRDNV